MTTIHVQLVNAKTQTVMGEADLPVEQLPESFAEPTTLHLGGSDWSVVKAEPMTRDEYVKTGALLLVLHPIETVDPKTILFSLPTIENTMPALDPGAASCTMHEDDWRQHELVSARFEPEIAAELADIRTVREDRSGPGFKTIHVRSRIPEPLGGRTITLADLAAALGDPARETVGLGGSTVTGGFAFAIGGGHIYGREDGGLVREVGVTRGTDASGLVAFARTNQLVLVDWCAASVERY
ncbi:MAG TPA: hypothetical protein VIU61_20820 [Kofleriaceae bacterium]